MLKVNITEVFPHHYQLTVGEKRLYVNYPQAKDLWALDVE
jgi:hypothetical protein